MAEMEQIFRKAIKALETSGIQYVIVGGLAAILRGSSRATSDIDVIVKNEEQLAEKIIQSFSKEGFEVMEEQLRIAIKEKFNTSIFTSKSVIRIDLKVAKNKDEFEVISEAVTGEFKELKFRIASIEQILYGKILYLGDISDLSDTELLDFNDAKDFLWVFNSSDSVDTKWLEKKAKEKGLMETLSRLLKKIDKNS